jgi:hypothetical protein
VAATYDLLCDFDSLDVDSDWRKVWSLEVQERIRHFMWIVKHNRLLTNYMKHKMHLGNAYCRHCGDTIETTMHVLRDCPMAMMVLVRIVDVDIRNQFFNVNLDNWLHLNLNFAGSVNTGKWSELWSITCHSLWMWRNKEEHCTSFDRPQQPWKQVINYAMRYVMEM